MAIVDLQTGKIIGTKKNSPIWWHEQGHITFNKLEKGMRTQYYFQFMIMVTIVILPLNLFVDNLLLRIYTLLCGLSVFYFYAYEEVWAWNYAIKKKRKWI